MLSKPLRGRRINQRHWSAKGLIGAWLFNEGCGTKAFDSSSQANTGILTNMAVSGWGATERGGGLIFDGSDDYVNCGTSDRLNVTDALTLTAWVKLNELPSVKNESAYFIVKAHTSSPWQSYSLSMSQWSDKIEAYVRDSSGGSSSALSNSALSKDVWYHIAATSKNGGKTKLYINGNIQTSQPNLNDTIFQSNHKLTLGGWATSDSLDGILNEVRIYDREFSIVEIGGLYRDEYAIFDPIFSLGKFYIPITARSYGYIF